MAYLKTILPQPLASVYYFLTNYLFRPYSWQTYTAYLHLQHFLRVLGICRRFELLSFSQNNCVVTENYSTYLIRHSAWRCYLQEGQLWPLQVKNLLLGLFVDMEKQVQKNLCELSNKHFHVLVNLKIRYVYLQSVKKESLQAIVAYQRNCSFVVLQKLHFQLFFF